MLDPEVRERINLRSEQRRGKKHTQATIRKMRAAARRRKSAAKKK